MRSLLLFFLFAVSAIAKAQTFSRIVSDKEIIDFINKDIARDSVLVTHWINKKYWKPDLSNFYFSDSADLITKRISSGFIFNHYKMNDGTIFSLDSVFTRKDIDNFKVQIKGLRKTKKWKEAFQNSILVENPVLDSTQHTKQVINNYSIPVFSLDHNYAIVIKGYYCGFLCGQGAYYLYRRMENDWTLIRVFNEWGE
jgi:hypothetical protein